MKQFLDSTGPLWMAGGLPGRTATAFTSTGTLHAEATILSLYQTMFHWGSIVVAPGYTQPNVAGGGQAPTVSPTPPDPDCPTKRCWLLPNTKGSASGLHRATRRVAIAPPLVP